MEATNSFLVCSLAKLMFYLLNDVWEDEDRTANGKM